MDVTGHGAEVLGLGFRLGLGLGLGLVLGLEPVCVAEHRAEVRPVLAGVVVLALKLHAAQLLHRRVPGQG